MRLFVTGTDTGVGKTVVAAWLCLHLGATYWKPIQSGLDGETDTQIVARLSGAPTAPEAYRLPDALSPHLSAARAGLRIALDRIVAPSATRLVIEGAGGLLVPLDETRTMADLIARLGAPVLVVARSGLGTINHTRLTLEALRARGLTAIGVVMVGEPNAENRRAIERYGRTSVLAEIPPLPRIDRATLAAHPLSDPFGTLEELWG